MRSNVGKCDTIGVSRRYGEMPYSILQFHYSARPPYRLDNEMAWTGGVLDSRCYMSTEKEKEYKRQWRAKNAARLKEYSAKYYLENKEYFKNYYSPEFYDKNREILRERRKRTNSKMGEHVLEKAKVARRRWRAENPDSKKVYDQNRRSRKKGNGGKITAAEWKAVKEKYGNKCLCCGAFGVKLAMDHVMPLALGGTNTADNVQPLCVSCNCKKNAKHIDYREERKI